MNNHPPLTIHASLALSLAVAVSAGLVNAAQSQARRSFETASIKVSKVSTLGRRPSVISHPPTLTAKNASLQDLIQMAYQVRDFQVSGGPAWIGSDQYDVNAKAVGNPTWAQTMGPMLQALLHDRFKLKLHRETKELPVYVLTVAKGGLKMQRSKEGNCTAFN